ncbi:MAG: rod shape-determining protein RodA [Cryomorphaceae bacterium]|nr:MAG: rod shape-determining protein RodA [Cryomorphaceae bacterium]
MSVALFLALLLIGWLNIYAAGLQPDHPSMFDTSQEYGKQFIWIVSSLIIAQIILLIEGSFMRRTAWLMYAVVMLLLVLVLIFGREVNGAKAWFGFGSFGIQPSEFSKFTIALMLAHVLSQSTTRLQRLETKFIVAAIILFPAMLIMLQPDTGTVLVYAAFVLVLYREGLSGNILFFGIIAAALSVLALLFKEGVVNVPLVDVEVTGQYVLMGAIAGMMLVGLWMVRSFAMPRVRKRATWFLVLTCLGSILLIGSVDYFVENILEPHQSTRIKILLGLAEDPLGAGYNVNQSKTAIGSGGFSGKGFLQGTLTRYKYVPMQSTDFIFCTIGEEWGFIGTSVVVILFAALILRLIFIAERQRSTFTRIYGYSVASIIFMHLLINVGMAIGLAPVIGIPLPFISYGGSSMWGFTILLFIFLKLDSERLYVLG